MKARGESRQLELFALPAARTPRARRPARHPLTCKSPLGMLRQLDLFPVASNRVALVACSAEKAPSRAPAEKLYRGHLFTLSAEWVKRQPDVYPRWAVLSAEHGVVMPGQELEPYDRRMASVDRRAWAARVAAQLRAQFGPDAVYTVLGGADYTGPLAGHIAMEEPFEAWKRAHKSAHPHARRWGLGQIKRRLRQELDRLEELERAARPRPALPWPVEVLGKREIVYQHGYGGPVLVQITRIALQGIEAFVREARRADSAEHFMLSSNARLGHKADRDRIGREVLELAAPAAHWEAFAAAVRVLDDLQREVIRHQRWTTITAPRDWELAEQQSGRDA